MIADRVTQVIRPAAADPATRCVRADAMATASSRARTPVASPVTRHAARANAGPEVTASAQRPARAGPADATGRLPGARFESHHRMKGSVHLVGAGPGDPELLTLKAVRAIRAATVLLVDDLVGHGVMEYARKSARIIHVGKRGGCASTPQAFIEKLMAAEALKGERVVRLKGGDPLLFGRGGEEIEHLQALGISVEVINGITSGLAAVNSLGVALTHRAHAHGVMFVTGHPRGHPHTEDEAVHWPTLAACGAQGITLVIYMGITTIEALQTGLLQGLPADTPVAVVQHASLPQQRSVVSQLSDLAAAVERDQLGSPSIIIVGNVLRGLAQVSASAIASTQAQAQAQAQQAHAQIQSTKRNA